MDRRRLGGMGLGLPGGRKVDKISEEFCCIILRCICSIYLCMCM